MTELVAGMRDSQPHTLNFLGIWVFIYTHLSCHRRQEEKSWTVLHFQTLIQLLSLQIPFKVRNCFKLHFILNSKYRQTMLRLLVVHWFIVASRICGRGNVFVVSVCVCVCLSVCVFVCMSVCLGYNFWMSWHRHFIFGMVLHLDHI